MNIYTPEQVGVRTYRDMMGVKKRTYVRITSKASKGEVVVHKTSCSIRHISRFLFSMAGRLDGLVVTVEYH